MTSEQFSLRWNNFHSNISMAFHELLEAHDMVDVTLAMEGQYLQAHKLVLSICSPYFKQLFKLTPCKHPVIILNDVTVNNMKNILHFMYTGEVNVLRENLTPFLQTAELLQVKGLTGDDNSDTSSKKDEKTHSNCDNEDESEYNHLIVEDTPASLPQFPAEVSPSPTRQHKTSTNSKRHLKHTANSKEKKIKREPNVSATSNTSMNNSTNLSDNLPLVDDSNEYIELTRLDQSYDKEDSSFKKENFYDSNTTFGSSLSDSNLQDHDGTRADKSVWCPVCNRKFVNRYNLKIHIRDKHDPSNNYTPDCVVCGKTMRNASCLRVHLYQHRRSQMKAEMAENVDTV